MARLYNLLTVLILALTAVLIAWMAVIAIDPTSRVNPFPPPTVPPTPSPTAQPKIVTPVALVKLPTNTPFPPTPTDPPPQTNTPLPTQTLVVQPTLTPLPTQPKTATQRPTIAATASSNLPTNPPPPPTASPVPQTTSGGFELGGQVAGFGFPDKMQYAGMYWVKRQLRWGPGASSNDAAGFINDAHGKGFKILLSVLGDPGSIRGGANYADYANYVGGVAALGADGIEVWNEMNIDREWPGGEINPASYVELLKQAYTSIKANNPNTLVVSGAPAPTGYFGGCSGNGCDDAPYIQGLVNAGALSYLDCIGIHYNEGVVSPTQTSGDPRGNPNHYTRYYQTMVDTYYNAGGGRKKLCFTELGYLSGEGYSPPLNEVAPGFAWAADTSVAEQAQWLAEAVNLAKASPKVRLIIVFNVDLTGWGSDPQGGYAIVRPGGGCPACDSLRGVTGGR